MPIYNLEKRKDSLFIDSHFTLLNDQSIYQGEPFTRRRASPSCRIYGPEARGHQEKGAESERANPRKEVEITMEGIGVVKSQVIAESEPAVRPMGVSEKVTNLPEKKPQGNPTKIKEAKEANDAKVELIAQAMDDYVKSAGRDLKIQVNSETGNVTVQVISEESGEVIREIPPEEVLKLAAKMDDMLGLLFNESV